MAIILQNFSYLHITSISIGLWRQWCLKTTMLIYEIQFKLQKMWPIGSFPGEQLTLLQGTKFNSTHLQLVKNVKNCSKLLNLESPQTQEYFYKLVEVLHEEPTTEKLGNQLLCDVKSKLASYIDILHSLHVYCIRCAVCTTCSTGQMLSAQSAAGWSKPGRNLESRVSTL